MVGASSKQMYLISKYFKSHNNMKRNPFPGATNVEEIQDELDGLLFGQEDKSDKIEKLKKSIPLPNFAGR